MTSFDAGELSTLENGCATRREVNGRAVVLVRIDDEVFALEDRCSHEDYPLSSGEVDIDSCEIECDRHGSMFHLRDGTPSSLPATKAVATYPVSVVSGRVLVEVAE